MRNKGTLTAILKRAEKSREAQQDTSAPRKARVYGPYRDGDKWRVVLCDELGQRVTKSLPSQADAEAFICDLEHQAQSLAVPRTIGEALAEYLDDRRAVGLKPNSMRSLSDRLSRFLPLSERLNLSPERASEIYHAATTEPTRYHRPASTTTHRLRLRSARAFYSWCIDRDYVSTNPFARVRAIGRMNVGKPQLRLDEVRQLVDLLRQHADAGHEVASALLLQLVFGVRSSEILHRQVRDVDDGGRVLWIPDGKTKNARRRLSIAEELQPLVRRLVEGRAADALLIGAGRTKPYTATVLWKHLRNFCRLAGVRQVCPHSLRGLHSTLAIEAGSTSGAVIAQLGHSSFQITERHYLDKDRHHDVSMRRVTSALLSPRDELQTALADLSPDEVRDLLAFIRSRRSAA